MSQNNLDQINVRRTRVDWIKDGNESGQTSISTLLSWLLKPENFSMYRGDTFDPITGIRRETSSLTKSAVCKEIELYFCRKGFGHRKADAIKHKIDRIMKDFRNARSWLSQNIQILRSQIYDDTNPENNALLKEKSIRDALIKRCQLYYELEPLWDMPPATGPNFPSQNVDRDHSRSIATYESDQDSVDEQFTLRVEPVRPEPIRLETGRPELSRPEPARPEPARPEPARPEPARPEPVGPEPARPEVMRPDMMRPEIMRPEQARQENTRQENTRQENTRQENTRQEHTKPEYSRQEHSGQEHSGQGYTRQGHTRQEPTRRDSARQEYIRYDLRPESIISDSLFSDTINQRVGHQLNPKDYFKEIGEKRTTLQQEELDVKRQKLELKKQKFEESKAREAMIDMRKKTCALWEVYRDMYKYELIDKDEYKEKATEVEMMLRDL